TQTLALVHVGCDDVLVGAGKQTPLAPEELGNDADDLTPVVVDRTGHHSHQANGTAAVHKTDLAGGEDLAEAAGGGSEAGVKSLIGPAIDTDARDKAPYSPCAFNRVRPQVRPPIPAPPPPLFRARGGKP